MISFDKLRLYTQKVNGIRFGRDPEEPHMLLYFSENSTLVDDYPYLNLRTMDFRNVVVPITKIPKTRLTSGVSAAYKSVGLRPFSSNQQVPQGQNFIFDLSNFLTELDNVYEPSTYRQRAGILIKNMLIRAFTMHSGMYNKTLLYTVNLQKEFYDVRNRKVFPILEQVKEEQFYFQNMILGTVSNRGVSYRSLMKDNNYDFKKMYNYLKMVKPRKQQDVDEEKASVNEEIFKKVSTVFSEKNMPKKKERITSALNIYFRANPDEYQKSIEGELDEEQMKTLAIKSVLYNVSGDISKSNRIANSIPKDKKEAALKSIENRYLDEVLTPGEAESFSKNVINGLMDITGAVDNIAPDQLFNKRQIDFEKNLVQDVTNIFKRLENKDYPLSVQDVRVEDKPPKAGELVKSDISVIKLTLKDTYGQEHKLDIDIPKIDPDSGTFRIDGIRQCLINQVVECPITFPKPYDGKFESSYSKFHIWSKRTKRKKYLEMYMGTFILPFLVFMGYAFGLEDTLKTYGINHEFVQEKPSKDQEFVKINENTFLLFTSVDSELKKEIVDSIKEVDFSKYNLSEKPGSREFFAKIIEGKTGRVNSTYLIDQNIENIVDPTAEHTLFNMQLPTDLKNIIYYIAVRVVKGHTIERNDLNNQRVRNSEVFSHLVQNQVNAAYTQYRQQVLSGNTQASLDIRKDSALHNFKLSEIVIPMEYANPVEEMSSITRIAPTGRTIGGIPDKRAIKTKSLNVHDSYFGNVDPLDTPESDRIGLVQQLSIGALLTSSRGLFRTKEITDEEASSMLSTSTALVPFLENNDGARVLMYSNQAKQMLPLKNPQPPIVQSGYESILPKHLSSVFNKKSPCKGKVEKIERDKISIRCTNNKIQEVDISPAHLRSGSGKDTLSVFRPGVNEGDKVESNEILAEGGNMSQGQISLGKNLLTAVMPYAGYNFEDAIIISDKLYNEGTLTSLHGIQETIDIAEEDRIVEMANVNDFVSKGDSLLKRTVGDLEELIGFHEDDEEAESNIDVSGREVSHISPGGTIVDTEVFTNIEDYEEKFPQLKSLIEKTNKKYNKPKGEKYTFRGRSIEGVRITFKMEQELPIGVGDKLANRYGNKGVISRVMEHSKMPVTPWGENVDIVLNPLGVVGRMNMGQLFELYCGLISRTIADRIKEDKTKKNVVNLFSRVMPKLDNTKNKEFSTKFINKLKNLSKEDLKKLIDQIEKDGLTPVIIPPFKGPKYSQIKDALKELDIQSGYNLRLPEFDGASTRNEVPVGYMYIAKLEHIGAEKLHSRSSGPVKSKSLQPTAGKRVEGGQRQGEQDTWSLISYDAIQTLNEMFGPLSDDHATKSEMVAEIVEEGGTEYKQSKDSPTRSLVNSYFTALMLEG